jgi:type IV secretion system protein VirB1
MLPGLEQFACQDLAVPDDVMEHVVRVESSFNPFAIGVVGGRLVRQPKTLREALATVGMLEQRGYNFSLGLAQVNRHNLARYGLPSYEAAFRPCPNLRAGARILAECRQRIGGDWGGAFSCYYSGNAVTGFRHGYVQKVFASMREAEADRSDVIRIVDGSKRQRIPSSRSPIHEATPAGRTSVQPSAAVMAMPGPPTIGQPAPSAPAVPAAAVQGRETGTGDHAFVF